MKMRSKIAKTLIKNKLNSEKIASQGIKLCGSRPFHLHAGQMTDKHTNPLFFYR